MIYLSPPPPNMNSIGEVCNSLGTDSLTLFVRNHWATGWLRVNSTSDEGRDYKRSFVWLHRVEMQGPVDRAFWLMIFIFSHIVSTQRKCTSHRTDPQLLKNSCHQVSWRCCKQNILECTKGRIQLKILVVFTTKTGGEGGGAANY